MPYRPTSAASFPHRIFRVPGLPSFDLPDLLRALLANGSS
jgi:hypothetical protein